VLPIRAIREALANTCRRGNRTTVVNTATTTPDGFGSARVHENKPALSLRFPYPSPYTPSLTCILFLNCHSFFFLCIYYIAGERRPTLHDSYARPTTTTTKKRGRFVYVDDRCRRVFGSPSSGFRRARVGSGSLFFLNAFFTTLVIAVICSLGARIPPQYLVYLRTYIIRIVPAVRLSFADTATTKKKKINKYRFTGRDRLSACTGVFVYAHASR